MASTLAADAFLPIRSEPRKGFWGYMFERNPASRDVRNQLQASQH